ncbi:exodeoxyribonuclease VII large subunit [Selenomonas caprae]|uniref:Exodeoxyribonuclease 7 large subunit n=1 Tax=Selenomonas caprae TaxID=2606905 RepID=A0A5D6WT85_9FIRM|nr:exodeoxyribonuclease VII large subunit [Selenomonas caprae]TYZ30198.1 exodeoxyribonuclease VII large subunit [Selenomonas caprae]
MAIHSVSQVNKFIKGMFDREQLLRGIMVRGEISNFKCYPSGHCYFTLKDANSSLKCVMFRSRAQNLRFQPVNGLKAVAAGSISVYERDGAYQLYVDSLAPEGTGDLALAFEQLKVKLTEEGLFAAEHKKALPEFPRKIGVVTSSAGAVLRDIYHVAKHRWPAVQLVLRPVQVQGEGAAAQVAEAIRFFNESYPVDVLIVGRGGGSMEDLWAFNEECVVRAVYASRIPVISAVGHETDFTLADFAADVRAATPSNAAELAVPDRADLQRHVAGLMTRLSTQAHKGIESRRLRLAALLRSRVLQEPQTLLAERRQRLDAALRQLCQLAQQAVVDKRHAVSLALEKLDGMNPARVLQRGYVAAEKDGQLVTRAAQLRPHDRLSLVLQDGRVAVEVMDKAVKAEKPRTRKEGK